MLKYQRCNVRVVCSMYLVPNIQLTPGLVVIHNKMPELSRKLHGDTQTSKQLLKMMLPTYNLLASC